MTKKELYLNNKCHFCVFDTHNFKQHPFQLFALLMIPIFFCDFRLLFYELCNLTVQNARVSLFVYVIEWSKIEANREQHYSYRKFDVKAFFK